MYVIVKRKPKEIILLLTPMTSCTILTMSSLPMLHSLSLFYIGNEFGGSPGGTMMEDFRGRYCKFSSPVSCFYPHTGNGNSTTIPVK